MTSVSRSEHDDEAPEGTGTAVSADRGRAVTPTAQKAVKSTDAAASPTTPKSGSSPRATKTTKSSTTSKGTTAAKAASASKGPRTTTAKNAARGAAADDASGDEAKSTASSKRTAASRAASSKAAAARGEAAKTARAARTSATKTPAARGRPATASTKRQTQQVAAALTTETTAAERANRKADEAEAAAATTAAAKRAAEIDETTRERPAPRRGAAAAASVGVAAAVTAAEPVIARPEASEVPATEVPEAEAPSAAPVAPAAPAEPAVAEDALEAVAAEEATAEPEASAAASGIAASGAVASGTASSGDQAVVVIPAPRKPAPRKKRTLRVARAAPAPGTPRVLAIEGLVKKFGDNTAVDEISLDVRAGSFYGIVGPNGAGKTTTLSMVTGLLRPDAGSVRINDIDAWKDPRAAKRATGVLPDRLRLFDRLTGAQLLYYAGSLRGIDDRTVRERSTELIAAFGLVDAVDRLVADYSAGMTKKIALACAMIHAPRLLVLDEPFESVDPVSAANLTDILERYVEGGGTVLLSSHGMDLIERVCDSAAIIVGGRVLAQGTLDEVRGGTTLEDRFVELAGGRKAAEGMEWLHSFSD